MVLPLEQMLGMWDGWSDERFGLDLHLQNVTWGWFDGVPSFRLDLCALIFGDLSM
jgi:hypothetical protein